MPRLRRQIREQLLARGAPRDIAALKLNSAESELVQRVGEGVMTADELDKAISEGLARRGSKLKRGGLATMLCLPETGHRPGDSMFYWISNHQRD